MTRRSKRELSRVLDDLDAGDAGDPPRWFRRWYADCSDAWLHEEWRRTVRRSRKRGSDVMAAAWIQNIKRSQGDLEGRP